MGQVPRFVTPLISPGIDVTQFLLLNRESLASGGISIASLSSFSDALTVVPPGELWYVHALTVVSAPLTAGQTLVVQPGYIVGSYFQAKGENVRATAGHRCSGGIWEGFWAPAGTTLAFRSNELTAGPIDSQLTFHITRLRI
jgi:hypothetical protein